MRSSDPSIAIAEHFFLYFRPCEPFCQERRTEKKNKNRRVGKTETAGLTVYHPDRRKKQSVTANANPTLEHEKYFLFFCENCRKIVDNNLEI